MNKYTYTPRFQTNEDLFRFIVDYKENHDIFWETLAVLEDETHYLELTMAFFDNERQFNYLLWFKEGNKLIAEGGIKQLDKIPNDIRKSMTKVLYDYTK